MNLLDGENRGYEYTRCLKQFISKEKMAEEFVTTVNSEDMIILWGGTLFIGTIYFFKKEKAAEKFVITLNWKSITFVVLQIPNVCHNS